MLLVQFKNEQGARKVGVLEDKVIRVIDGYSTTYALAQDAIRKSVSLAVLAEKAIGAQTTSFDAIAAAGRLLSPLDHSDDAHTYVTGTGLTHLGSADTRDAMHKKIGGDVESLSDSMKMFRMGVEGGKPAAGQAGVQPEWFYKGDGTTLVGTGMPLTSPAFALDAGEEPEIAGIYLIDRSGNPVRLGFTLGNEFSDHVTERGNYLWLAHSKLRQAALGAELLLGDLPQDVRGASRILRDGVTLWEKPFLSGETNMSHSIANLEHHHFKYGLFRRPGDVHVHFFGTATASFADGVTTQPGDIFEIEADAFRLPLRNPLEIAPAETVVVRSL